MSAFPTTPRPVSHSQLQTDLTDLQRRSMTVLLGRTAPTTEGDLAAELSGGAPAIRAGDRSTKELQVRLRHVALPKLADAGLVEWDRSEQTVAAADHPVLDERALERAVNADADRWDDHVPGSVTDRDRTLASVLELRDDPLERAELARAVAVRETDGQPSAEAIDEVEVALHHVHLPKLEAAGLLEYGDGTVEFDADGRDDAAPTPGQAAVWLEQLG